MSRREKAIYRKGIFDATMSIATIGIYAGMFIVWFLR